MCVRLEIARGEDGAQFVDGDIVESLVAHNLVAVFLHFVRGERKALDGVAERLHLAKGSFLNAEAKSWLSAEDQVQVKADHP